MMDLKDQQARHQAPDGFCYPDELNQLFSLSNELLDQIIADLSNLFPRPHKYVCVELEVPPERQAEMEKHERHLPAGTVWVYPFTHSQFVRHTDQDAVKHAKTLHAPTILIVYRGNRFALLPLGALEVPKQIQ
jgi:hypothetical protein